MRRLLVLPLLLLLAACTGDVPYTQQDLQQVKQAYAELRPVYVDFQQAYFENNAPRILRDYQAEQRDCHLVDAVDKRDTIDPNTRLFQASVGLDNFCNDIESAYAGWAQLHGYPYPKDVVPATGTDAFIDGNLSLKKMSFYLSKPAALG